MSIVMIYSSGTGATKTLFEGISKVLENSKVFSVKDVEADDLKDAELVVIGSPTYFLGARKDLLRCLESLKDHFNGKNVAIIALYAIAGVDTNIEQIKSILKNANFLGELKLRVLWFRKPTNDDVNSAISFIKSFIQ